MPASPLTPTTLHVLLALADGPLHGYAILKEAERLGDGQRPLGAGTLYAILKRLLDAALIAETSSPGASEGGGAGEDARRRYYTLTTAGRHRARDELRRLDTVVRMGRERRLLEDPG